MHIPENSFLQRIAESEIRGDRQALSEASVGRVVQHFTDPGKSFAVVSAFRDDRSHEENMAKHKELTDLLSGKLHPSSLDTTQPGWMDSPEYQRYRKLQLSTFPRKRFGFIKSVGVWPKDDKPDPGEEDMEREMSVIIPNIDQARAHNLAKAFNQKAYIYRGPETKGVPKMFDQEGQDYLHSGSVPVIDQFSKIFPRQMHLYHTILAKGLPVKSGKGGIEIPASKEAIRQKAFSFEEYEPNWEERWFPYTWRASENRDKYRMEALQRTFEPVNESAENHTDRVRRAIENTPDDYLRNQLSMRSASSPQNAGSVYDNSPEEIKNSLLQQNWGRHDHPAIASPAVGFKADMPGRLGIVPLASLPGDHHIDLEDPKNTGKVSAVASNIPVERTRVGHTTMIVGPRQDGKGEQVWTFHPGDPIKPSEVSGTKAGKTDASGAQKLGLDFAKIRS